jgi:hypothetical protein
MASVFLALAIPSLTITPNALVTDEDKPLDVTLQADVAGARFKVGKPPRRGTATINEKTGALNYVAWPDFHGADRVRIEVSADGKTINVDVPITVNAVNDPPVAEPLKLTTREDAATSGALKVTDVDRDKPTFTIGTPPARGAATVDAKGKVTFTPAADAAGADRFVVVVNDGANKVEVPVDVDIAAVNDAPTIAAARIEGAEDAPATTTVTANDVDGDPLAFEVKKAPRQGTATIDAKTGVLTFAPAADWNGDAVITVVVTDGKAKATTDVAVRLTPVNDPPRGQPLKLSTSEDTPVAGVVDAREVDGDKLAFSIAIPPSSGTATVDVQGKVAFTPTKDASGSEKFVVVVDDGTAKVEIPVTVDVSAVNDAPTVASARIDGTEDTTATVQLSGADVDGDKLSWELKKAPKRGTATVDAATGLLRFVPEPDWNGAVSATVRVTDGKGSADVDVPIVIAAVNDAPVVQPLRLVTPEDAATSAPIEARDVDRDKLSFSITTPSTLGTASVDARGRVTYKPERDKNGADRFVVAIADGTATVELPVEVKVEAVNDAPVSTSSPLSFAEDTELTATLSATDVDGDRLRFRATTAPNAGGRFSISSSGELRWAPPTNHNGRDKVTFEVDDGTARTAVTLPLTVTPVNDAPTLKARSIVTNEDAAAVTEAVANDIDGDRLTLRIEKQGEKSTATVDSKGVVKVTPNKDVWGKDTIVVAAFDGTTTVTDAFVVTIEPQPDPPLVRDERLATAEDTAAEATLPASDPDGDAVTFKLTSTGNLGKATLLDARTGRVAYSPNKDAFGDDVIGFEVNDGVDDRRHRVAGRLTVTVQPVDDAPVAADAAAETDEDTVGRGRVTMTDVDGDALALTIVKPPEQGTARIEDAAQGTFAVEPARDFHGELSFVVAAAETASGRLTSSPATVRVKVKPVNDPPACRGISLSTKEDTAVNGAVVATDIDRDTLRFLVTRQPEAGQVTLDAQSGKLSYTPRKNMYGSDSFVVTVDDGAGGSASASVDVSVSPVDDAPVAIPGELMAPRNGRAVGRLQGRDPEGNPLTFRIVEPPSLGTLKLLDEKSGEYAFAIQGGPKGRTAPFRFVVNAGGKTSEPVTVIIRIE